VRFGVPGDVEHIFDKVGNSMEGHSEYTFTTTQFHVVPGSGFPTDNLRIGACDQFSLRFSNKYDMSPENQQKLEVYRLDTKGTPESADDEITTPNDDCGEIVPVAGGVNCVETADGLDPDGDGIIDFCAAPCLTVDIADQATGEIRVEINPTEFGPILKVEERYRMSVFGLDELGDIDDDDAYRRSFWDACGMPLVAEDAAPYNYDFTIDEPKCKEDLDRDDVQFSCDNADEFFNPDQADLDRDGIGDVVDLCPTVGSAQNSADSDKDGVGNDCDVCRQTLTQYNQHDNGISVPDYMFVRNIPWQVDTDEDGIGDVCDNCVQHANCQDYGPDNPYLVGEPIAFDDDNQCQRDDAANLIGDACESDDPMEEFPLVDGAAGPIGVGDSDDFDQDGIINTVDACPRQPVSPRVECTDGTECGPMETCEDGVCDHIDSDDDSVGDICDTCPFSPNPMQTMDGAAQDEDEDGDFVGKSCETNAACSTRIDARPFSFHAVQSNGLCCTVQIREENGLLVNAITGRQLEDPDLRPITLDCEEPDDLEDATCRKLPNDIVNAPGILTVPPGCEEALEAAGLTAEENVKLGLEDVGTFDELWGNICFLPQTDQDFDGYGDLCDFCKFQYDPDNTPYVDENGRAWPSYGKYCNGDYAPDVLCETQDPTDTEADSGTGGSTAEDSGGMMTEDSGGMGTSGG
jgi:hypothetical protein